MGKECPSSSLYHCNCAVASAIWLQAHLAALLPPGQQAPDSRVLQSPGKRSTAHRAARGGLGTAGMTVLLVQGGTAWPLLKQREGTELVKESPENRGWPLLEPTGISASQRCGQIWIIGAARQMQMSFLVWEGSPASLHSGGTLAHLAGALATG